MTLHKILLILDLGSLWLPILSSLMNEIKAVNPNLISQVSGDSHPKQDQADHEDRTPKPKSKAQTDPEDETLETDSFSLGDDGTQAIYQPKRKTK